VVCGCVEELGRMFCSDEVSCWVRGVSGDSDIEGLSRVSLYPGGFPNPDLESVRNGTAGMLAEAELFGVWPASTAASWALYGGGASPYSLNPSSSSSRGRCLVPNRLWAHLLAAAVGCQLSRSRASAFRPLLALMAFLSLLRRRKAQTETTKTTSATAIMTKKYW